MEKIKLNEILDMVTNVGKTVKIGKSKINVKQYLSSEKFIEFVNTVVDSCFDDKGNYHAEYKEVVYRYEIVSLFTNIDISEMSVSEVYDCSNQAWYEGVLGVIPVVQIAELNTAIDDKIDYRIRTKRSSFDELCDTLLNVVENQSNDINKIDNIVKEAKKLSKTDFVKAVVNNKGKMMQ